MDPEPDDPPRVLIHDDEDPMGLESKGLTTEKIDAPQTTLHVTKEGQPGGSVTPLWPVVSGEDSCHHIFIERMAKVLEICSAILGHPSWDYDVSFPARGQSVPGRTLRPRVPSFPCGEQQAIFPFDQGLMIFQESGGFDQNGGPLDAARIKKDGPEAQ